ncbi:hypothetical protein [Candidatus Dactylopiibacterium carminicum]|uniref:hypothetical protein n=1 Tax=Candidatus Dactylopiibacterium carminicum TaxID=857335 RepID=UPI001482F0E8|nr:hypothetical protein [Candidatus Dactylopiibacterium carminicum]
MAIHLTKASLHLRCLQWLQRVEWLPLENLMPINFVPDLGVTADDFSADLPLPEAEAAH